MSVSQLGPITGSWAADNTIVADATGGMGLILHKTGQTHTISWSVSHLDYEQPTFEVAVDIYALGADEPLL